MSTVLIGLGIYVAFLAVLLFGYWVYGVIADRLHARRTVAAFDRFVERLDRKDAS